MFRIIAKFGVSVVIVCLLLSFVALMLADLFPARIVLFLAGDSRNPQDQTLHVAHLERYLTLRFDDNVGTTRAIDISPQVEWLLYGQVEGEFCYKLVNLQTWESQFITLPRVDGEGCSYIRYWLADGSGIEFIFITNQQAELAYVYDFASSELSVLDEALSFDLISPPALTDFFLRPGISIPNRDRTDLQSITVDEEGFPRFYDPESGVPIVESNSDFGMRSLSLSPDYEFFAASLNLDSQFDLYLVPVWEGEPLRVTNDRATESVPLWSPDGRYVSFLARDAGRTDLHVYNVESGAIEYEAYLDDSTIARWNVVWIP